LRKVFEAKQPIDSVIHFAAYKSVGESVEQPVHYYRNNIDSLLSVMEVMKECSVNNLIFSSSCTVYGQPDVIPVKEDAPFKRAESPYAATKQMCERILEDSFLLGFKVISLRYFNPIGAHPSGLLGEIPIGRPNNLVPFITQTAIGKREKLTIFGNDYQTPDGSCIRDYIHVVDLADVHVKALNLFESKQENFYDVFNVGTGVGVSVLELIHQFESATGVKLNYQIGPRRPGDIEKTYADPTKVMNALAWKPNFSNSEALLHSWNWEKKLAGK
jgi:UDP-glucose 4-epimerase